MSQMLKACVIGWPIKHSRSPIIHGYWLKRYRIAGTYTKEAVRPEDVRAFLSTLAQRGFCGCNVTLPHKHAALAAADEKDPSATAVGAANTLWLDGGKLWAANTDVHGFMTHLSTSVPDWKTADAPASVLGAGGAARAVVYGLLEAGVARVRVFNRTLARAEELAQHFGGRVESHPWSAREAMSRDAGLIVNTTALGMTGVDPLDFEVGVLGASAVVCDIVYTPLETDFLRRARARSLRTVDGLGMLMHQAVPGFTRWFGRTPEVTGELRELLVADIEGS
jgi:shikimate dehydrogenase